MTTCIRPYKNVCRPQSNQCQDTCLSDTDEYPFLRLTQSLYRGLFQWYQSLGALSNILFFLKNSNKQPTLIDFIFNKRYDYNFWACMCVVFHDFLDHLDGIVAKVQRVTYPNHDDPLLGGFLDAFCDKIVNVLSIWTIIQSIDLSNASEVEIFFYLFISYAVISYESIIGVVRVQDFFLAKFKQ